MGSHFVHGHLSLYLGWLFLYEYMDNCFHMDVGEWGCRCGHTVDVVGMPWRPRSCGHIVVLVVVVVVVVSPFIV